MSNIHVTSINMHQFSPFLILRYLVCYASLAYLSCPRIPHFSDSVILSSLWFYHIFVKKSSVFEQFRIHNSCFFHHVAEVYIDTVLLLGTHLLCEPLFHQTLHRVFPLTKFISSCSLPVSCYWY